MTPPKIIEETENFYFTVEQRRTCDLILFLRQHIPRFSVDIGKVEAEEEDLFEFSKSDTQRAVLEGLVQKFFSRSIR